MDGYACLASSTAGPRLIDRRHVVLVRVTYPQPLLVHPLPENCAVLPSYSSFRQEAASLLSRASSIDAHDTDSPYNAACAFTLSGDAASCFQALTEFCRRLVATVAASDVSSSKRDAARWSLREASGDVDLEGVRGADWFVGLLSSTDAALAGGT